jgi:hypothetical protein
MSTTRLLARAVRVEGRERKERVRARMERERGRGQMRREKGRGSIRATLSAMPARTQPPPHRDTTESRAKHTSFPSSLPQRRLRLAAGTCHLSMPRAPRRPPTARTTASPPCLSTCSSSSRHSISVPIPCCCRLSGGCSEALAVDDDLAGVLVLLGRDPHLLEGRERRQDRGANKDRERALVRRHRLHLPIRRCATHKYNHVKSSYHCTSEPYK